MERFKKCKASDLVEGMYVAETTKLEYAPDKNCIAVDDKHGVKVYQVGQYSVIARLKRIDKVDSFGHIALVKPINRNTTVGCYIDRLVIPTQEDIDDHLLFFKCLNMFDMVSLEEKEKQGVQEFILQKRIQKINNLIV